ncbi:DUF1697 domain-containing protein [Bacillus sp. Marseille-Q3570]|uniref:DUF1697 domain-containing protein n=1 Tax=Bacillus sp. Marseille-Q3570 TaxID=2963522 RepID=UPI0021B8063C|nr:DUF1697 domain-containing protein [Bacillus sp. Marseille-Q3570]
MPVYITLLRGINVGGKKKVKMDQLKEIFASLGFRNVKTYIQSGNVIFAAVESEGLAVQIERKLKEELGFEVPVLIKTLGEWEKAIEQNPYDVEMLDENEKLHVTFLAEEPTTSVVENLMMIESDVDEIRILGGTVYILCRNGYHKTLFSNAFIEKKLGVRATTRNWNSVLKIADMSKALVQ